jgi:N-acetylneuraminic acid mutarotase
MQVCRSSRRRFISALALGACLGAAACGPAPAARSAARAGATGAAELSGAASAIHPRFAGILPRGLTTVGATTLGDALYLVGGYFGPPHEYSKEYQSGSVLRMQLSSGVWEELASVEPIQSPALVGDGIYLYQLGGMRADNAAREPAALRSVAEAERFDPSRNRWQPIPSMPEPRSSHQAVVVDGKLYVVGGWALDGGPNDGTWRDTMLIADLSQPTLTWQSTSVPFQVRAMGLVAQGHGIYVLGGLTPEGSTTLVRRYDIATGTWADGPSLPPESSLARGAVHDGRLYVTGGDGAIYRLSADELTWERVGALRYPRLFHEMVASEAGPLVLAGIPENTRGGRVRVIERLSEQPAPAGVVLNFDSPTPAKNRQGAFLWSEQLVVFGGNNGLGQYDLEPANFERGAARLDLGALEWHALPEFPSARQNMQAVVTGADDASAWIVGGMGFQGNVLRTTGELIRHDLQKKEWTTLGQPLAEGRAQFGLAEHAGKLWAFGGMTYDGSREPGDQLRVSAQILTLDTQRAGARFVDAGVSLAEPRRGFAGALAGDTYYVVGGLREGFTPVESCEAIELEARRSRPLPCPADNRMGAELVALGGKLYLLGGTTAISRSERQPSTLMEVLDPETESWVSLPAPLPLDSGDQLRAFAFGEQLLVYSAQRGDMSVQIGLLDPAAIAAGRKDYVRMNVPKPAR